MCDTKQSSTTSTYSECVDIVDGQPMLFNGSSFCPIEESESCACFPGKHDKGSSISKFVGVLHTTAKNIVKVIGMKDGICRKRFTPFNSNFPQMLVKTTKLKPEPIDDYAIVKYEKMEGDIMYCEVVEYLGKIGDYESELKVISALACCNWLRKHDRTFINLSTNDLTPDRINLTHLDCVYSVDPIGCEDIDDACHVVKLDNGYEVGIHIADVSSYIPENSIYDDELANRVETMYFKNNDLKKQILHMIPQDLSLNIISLKSDTEKRAFSVIITLNNEFDILCVRFEKTIIKVQQNLSYECAQLMIESNENIKLLYDVAFGMKQKILQSFDPKIIYDTHQMIEVFMIYANKLVAESLVRYDPDNSILRTQYNFAPRTQSSPIEIESSETESDVSEEPTQELLNKHNSLQLSRARYKLGNTNCHHSSLHIDYYTHFTSPMRRYCDILVHRQLYMMLKEQQLSRISTQKIFYMNYFSHFYKQIARYSHLIEVLEKIDDVIEITGFVTLISNNSTKINIYVPDIDLDLKHRIINKKLSHLVTSTVIDNKLIIQNNKQSIQIKLFQQVRIKISKTILNINKINIAMVDPNILELFDLSESL